MLTFFRYATIARQRRGDTLIEVLIAITVFSLVIVSTMALMNQGTSAARRTVEMSLVREELDGQAETLRFMHAAYVANYTPGITYSTSSYTSAAGEYYRIIDMTKATGRTNATAFGDIASCPSSTPAGSFFVNPRTAHLVNDGANLTPATSGYAQLAFTSDTAVTAQGIWIESIRTADESAPSNTSNAGYIDFYIRACWYAPGVSSPLTMGTIVRLYEPRG